MVTVQVHCSLTFVWVNATWIVNNQSWWGYTAFVVRIEGSISKRFAHSARSPYLIYRPIPWVAPAHAGSILWCVLKAQSLWRFAHSARSLYHILGRPAGRAFRAGSNLWCVLRSQSLKMYRCRSSSCVSIMKYICPFFPSKIWLIDVWMHLFKRLLQLEILY